MLSQPKAIYGGFWSYRPRHFLLSMLNPTTDKPAVFLLFNFIRSCLIPFPAGRQSLAPALDHWALRSDAKDVQGRQAWHVSLIVKKNVSGGRKNNHYPYHVFWDFTYDNRFMMDSLRNTLFSFRSFYELQEVFSTLKPLPCRLLGINLQMLNVPYGSNIRSSKRNAHYTSINI
ncbi:hypothetical protein V202x_08550 [Gimesia aquarii]|uniref:Uncharacterized protein n=1 Tax=Gimesia aquarii TaxID=2527964 RepID=A0A517WQG1_9PLAN|nr:hypothetical protein V202x_08550 [Gimesia aquarii]